MRVRGSSARDLRTALRPYGAAAGRGTASVGWLTGTQVPTIFGRAERVPAAGHRANAWRWVARPAGDAGTGFGGILLGGVVAAYVPVLDPELFDDLDRSSTVEAGYLCSMPACVTGCRPIGWGCGAPPLQGEGEQLRFEIDLEGAGAPHRAVYAGGPPIGARSRVMETIRKAMRWTGAMTSRWWPTFGVGPSSRVVGRGPSRPGRVGARRARAGQRPPASGRRAIQRQFRDLVRSAHPDHGGDRPRPRTGCPS